MFGVATGPTLRKASATARVFLTELVTGETSADARRNAAEFPPGASPIIAFITGTPLLDVLTGAAVGVALMYAPTRPTRFN